MTKILKLVIDMLPNDIKKNIYTYIKKKKALKNYNPNQYKEPKFESSIAALQYHKCIFVHIPKNAGLSVSYALFGNTGGSHRKIKDYQELFSRRAFIKYYKFTFVRNPWDRLVSTYFFLKEGGVTEKDRIWSEDHLSSYKDFKTFVKLWLNEENISNSLHFQKQCDFLQDNQGNLSIDFIGRFENIEADFKTITNELNIKRNLRKTNSSKRKQNYREYYDEETKNIVSEVYKQDIKLFNYSF